MQIVDAKVTREKPFRAYCYVRLFEDGRWKAWPPVPNPLPLTLTSGKWIWRAQVPGRTPPDVLLMDDGQTRYALLFDDVPQDFFKHVCVKTLSGRGLVHKADGDDDPIRYVFMSPSCTSLDAAGVTDDGDDADDDE
jgi:hypothetical protein